MRDTAHELLCAAMLGCGQLCMLAGYDTQSFISESVLRSVHDQRPDAIDAHAGYRGQAVVNTMVTLSSLISPYLLTRMGSKNILVLGSCMFTLFFASYLYVHFIPFYITTVLTGFGFALFFTGNGAYITEHSTRKTLERNSSMSWGIGTFCMVAGGIVLLFSIQPPISSETGNNTNGTFSDRTYRVYSEGEIRLLFGLFVGIAIVSNIVFALLPSKQRKLSMASVSCANEDGFTGEMKLMYSAMKDGKVALLVPLFFLLGTTITFWISVFPTTLVFTKSMSGFVYLPAYYAITLGTSDMCSGLLISFVSHRIPGFGQMPTLFIGIVFHMTGLTLALLSTPPWSTNTPNDEPAPLIQSSIGLALFISLLFGLADNCFNTSRTVMSALIMPDKRPQVFSISRFYQSLITGILFFVSPFMSMPMYFILITLNSIAALICYHFVVKLTMEMERENTLQSASSFKSDNSVEKGETTEDLP